VSYSTQSGTKTNTMAVLALLAALTISPVGIVLAYIARKQIRASGERGFILTRFALYLGYGFSFFYLIAIVFGVEAASRVAEFTSLF
jgi:hypothetical protein